VVLQLENWRYGLMETTSTLQEKIETYRYTNVEDNWWHSNVTEDFKDHMKTIGFDVDNVYFSGFCSQGDGACFTGTLEDPVKLISVYFNKPEEYRLIKHILQIGGGLTIDVSHQGRYYHSNSVSFSIDCDCFTDLLDTSTPLHEDTAYVLDIELGDQLIAFEEDVVPLLKSFMDKLYRDLEKEYDFLTSDEQVKEAIESNGM
jgi:hypothetical protein